MVQQAQPEGHPFRLPKEPLLLAAHVQLAFAAWRLAEVRDEGDGGEASAQECHARNLLQEEHQNDTPIRLASCLN